MRTTMVMMGVMVGIAIAQNGKKTKLQERSSGTSSFERWWSRAWAQAWWTTTSFTTSPWEGIAG